MEKVAKNEKMGKCYNNNNQSKIVKRIEKLKIIRKIFHSISSSELQTYKSSVVTEYTSNMMKMK